jgi:SAM-dependent methyltransferase
MRVALELIMARRARALAAWLAPHLPARGLVVDIGAGTGHNAQALRARSALSFVGVDVVNMRVVGARPVLFDGTALPFADDRFQAALLLFVLPYCADPLGLLRAIRRVTGGPVLVLQSTYVDRLGALALRANDLLWGPVAFGVARAAGWIAAERCALYGRNYYTRPHLQRIFQAAGFRARLAHSAPWPLVSVRYDLFVLERRDAGQVSDP